MKKSRRGYLVFAHKTIIARRQTNETPAAVPSYGAKNVLCFRVYGRVGNIGKSVKSKSGLHRSFRAFWPARRLASLRDPAWIRFTCEKQIMTRRRAAAAQISGSAMITTSAGVTVIARARVVANRYRYLHGLPRVYTKRSTRRRALNNGRRASYTYSGIIFDDILCGGVRQVGDPWDPDVVMSQTRVVDVRNDETKRDGTVLYKCTSIVVSDRSLTGRHGVGFTSSEKRRENVRDKLTDLAVFEDREPSINFSCGRKRGYFFYWWATICFLLLTAN